MSFNFLDRGLGALVPNKDAQTTAFVVKKSSSSSDLFTSSLLDVDLGSLDHLNDAFKTKKQVKLDLQDDQPTLVKWNSYTDRSLSAIGLSSGSLLLVDINSDASPTNVSLEANSPVSGLEFSFHDPLVGSISQDGFFNLVDLNSNVVTNISGKAFTSSANTSLSWNYKVGHIIATNDPSGNINIWDTKLKKTATTFGNNTQFSSLHWIPMHATQLVTTSTSAPSIQLWDLRNTGTPVKDVSTPCLVKSLIFNPHDHSLFLTSGVSGTTDQLMLWNVDFELQNALPFQYESSLSFTQSYFSWSLYNPALVLWNSSESMALFNIYSDAKVTNVPHVKPLKSGIATGFGSRLVTYSSSSDVVTGFKVIYDKVKVDMSIVESDVTACRRICEYQGNSSNSLDEYDKTSWLVTSAYFTCNRDDILSAIGFDSQQVVSNAKKLLGESADHSQLAQETEDPEQFFRDLGQQSEESARKIESDVNQGDDKKIDPDVAKALDDCISIGNLSVAAELCLLAGRTAEALLLAHQAGTDEWNRISRLITTQSTDPLITKIATLTSGDIEALIKNADLNEWILLLAAICTFGGSDFVSYCNSLADKLLKSGMPGASKAASVCYQVAGDINSAFDNWYGFSESIERKVLRMAMFQKASRNSPTGSSLDKFVSLVSKLSERLAQSGFVNEALGILSVVQPQQSVEMQVYKISQLHGGAFSSPPYSTIPIYFTGTATPSKPVTSGVSSFQQPHVPQPAPVYQHAQPPATPAPIYPGSSRSSAYQYSQPSQVPSPFQQQPSANVYQQHQPAAPSPSYQQSLSSSALGSYQRPQVGTPAPAYQQPQTSHVPTNVQSYPQHQPAASVPSYQQPQPVQHSNFNLNTAKPAPVTAAPPNSTDPVYPGMPVSWPKPTPTQQFGSSASSSGRESAKSSAPPSSGRVEGAPMSTSDFNSVTSTIKTLVARALVQEPSNKKAQEIQLRIDQLFENIKSCSLSEETNSLLVQMCKAIDASDYVTANKLLNTLYSNAWNSNNKTWILVLKRIVPR